MADTLPRPRLTERLARAGYGMVGSVIALLAPGLLRRRLARGKELPDRWREKLGHSDVPRPAERLVWLHAVGLGEALALRGLILAMSDRAPDLRFLVTSSTRTSAQVLAQNLPPQTVHQFLPLDAPRLLNRFLDHWRPDLVVWSEQDIWPGAIFATAARGVPQTLVNARITEDSFTRRRRLAPLYRAALRPLALVDAQEAGSAARLTALGARDVAASGSLKPAGPALSVDMAELETLRAALHDRRIWVAGSTHPGDEAAAIAAMQALDDPAWLLIVAPRDIARADSIAQAFIAAGMPPARRSQGQIPGAACRVWLADSYGEMGLWYRLAEVALVGGGFDAIGGHNPWEPARLGAAILHGPDTANFSADYAQLAAAGAARAVTTSTLAEAITDSAANTAMAARANVLVAQAATHVSQLADRLCALIKRPPCA
jgi:3-deoxy-D-manno-octulosonic-acid transferase